MTIYMPSVADLVGYLEENPNVAWNEIEVTRCEDEAQDITYSVPQYLINVLAQTLNIGARYEALQILVNTSYVQQSQGDIYAWSEVPGEPIQVTFTIHYVPQWIYDYLVYIDREQELPRLLTSETGYTHLRNFLSRR